MYQLSIILAIFNVLLLVARVLAVPLPLDQSSTKRQNTGRGTWFYDEANQSACGDWDRDSDWIVAISSSIYGNGGSCGSNVWIYSNGVSVTAKVADECEGCGPNDLDMSTGLFLQFAPLEVGELSISWGWE